jgi:hypothetical protein
MHNFDTPEKRRFTVLEDIESAPKEPSTKFGCGFCSFDRKKVDKLILKTKASIQDKGLSNVPTPQVKLSLFGNQLPLLRFLGRFCFDLLILFPFYFVKTSFFMFYLAGFYLIKCKFLMVLKVIIVHILDLVQALAIVGLIFTVLFYERDLYYEWAVTCLILFISFILLTSYISLTVEAEMEARKPKGGLQIPMTWKDKLFDAFHDRHFHNLGLGKFQAEYLPEEKSVGRKAIARKTVTDSKLNLSFASFYELVHEIQRIFKKLNIDPTFLLYSNFYDPPIIETHLNESLSSKKKMDEGKDNIETILRRSAEKKKDSDSEKEKKRGERPIILLLLNSFDITMLVAPVLNGLKNLIRGS